MLPYEKQKCNFDQYMLKYKRNQINPSFFKKYTYNCALQMFDEIENACQFNSCYNPVAFTFCVMLTLGIGLIAIEIIMNFQLPKKWNSFPTSVICIYWIIFVYKLKSLAFQYTQTNQELLKIQEEKSQIYNHMFNQYGISVNFKVKRSGQQYFEFMKALKKFENEQFNQSSIKAHFSRLNYQYCICTINKAVASNNYLYILDMLKECERKCNKCKKLRINENESISALKEAHWFMLVWLSLLSLWINTKTYFQQKYNTLFACIIFCFFGASIIYTVLKLTFLKFEETKLLTKYENKIKLICEEFNSEIFQTYGIMAKYKRCRQDGGSWTIVFTNIQQPQDSEIFLTMRKESYVKVPEEKPKSQHRKKKKSTKPIEIRKVYKTQVTEIVNLQEKTKDVKQQNFFGGDDPNKEMSYDTWKQSKAQQIKKKQEKKGKEVEKKGDSEIQEPLLKL